MEIDPNAGMFRKTFRKIALPTHILIIAALLIGLILKISWVYYSALATFILLILLEKLLGPSIKPLGSGDILYRLRSRYRRLWDEHLFLMSFIYVQLVLIFIIVYDRPRFDVYLIISILVYEAIFFMTYYTIRHWRRNRLSDMELESPGEDEAANGNIETAGPIIRALRKERQAKKHIGNM